MYRYTKLFSALVLTLFLAGILANCASLSQSNNPGTFTIAVVESNPGAKDAPDEQSIYAGVKLALDQYGEHGGVNIQIDLYDDKNDPAEAAKIAQTIVDSDAVAVIGHSSFETSDAAGDLYDANGIPVINAIPVTEHLTQDHSYHFNITYTAESEAAYLASYLIKTEEKITAGIIHTNDRVSENAQRDFRNLFVRGGGIVNFRETITLDPVVVVEQIADQEIDDAGVPAVQETSELSDNVLVQLKDIVSRIASIPDVDKPRILFISASDEVTAKLKQMLSEQGISIPVKGTEILDETVIAGLITKKTASIISSNDGYGQTLAKQFKNTFQGLGGQIILEKTLTSQNPLPRELDDIVSSVIKENNPGTLFIATDDITAAELIILMKQKGISYPLVGVSNLSSPAFMEKIDSTAEERTFPGYYTDGILTTRAIIFDSANRYANQFLEDYQGIYKSSLTGEAADPGDIVVNGYDAALALATAIQNSVLSGTDAKADREKVYKTLQNMDGVDSGTQGIISPIFFEPSRNITRAARFGIYQDGRIVSANIQFEPITNPSEIKDLQEQVRKGRIMTVNGGYVYKANVVYSGVDILSIEEIDIKTSTYNVDFYLWFRYRPNERDEDFKPDEFVFTNAEAEPETALIREETNSDGTVLKTYRVSGTFKNQFRFYDYPFDHQNLVVEFRNQNATTSFIQYVVDRIGMRYENDDQKLLENFSDNGAFDSIFGWKAQDAYVSQDIFPTFSTFGSPQNFGRSVATNYSLINIHVDVQRDSLQYIIKSLLPLLITLVLAYITFFLPLGHSERLAVGSTALLTTAFFHLALADALPEIGYTVAMEYLFYASYVMSALMVLLETLSIRFEKRGEDAKKKADKLAFQKQREDLNRIGRVVYPSILLLVLVGLYFVYNGAHLGPKEAEAKHLVDIAMGTTNLSTVTTESNVSANNANEIKLTLSTWRPEDEEQIQVLLNEFQAFAKARGQNIIIEHKPVVSVNYDSILDISLNSEEGPDLFYVRPFSVDGNIAKHLLQLNSELPIESNFDETKIVPWTSKSGSYYAVPYVGVVQGVYYNKDFFTDHPEILSPDTWSTWTDLLVNVQKIKTAGKIPIANALNQSEDSEMFMSIAANFIGGPDGRANLMRTDGTSLCYNNQKVIRTFQAIEDLKPYLPEDAATINSQTSKELFFSGDAVLLFGGSWDLKTVSDGATFNWDVFAVPAHLSKTYVIFQPDVGIGINRDTQNPGAAKMFLNWLMTEEAIDLTAQNLAGFYPLSNIKATVGSGPNDEKFLALVRNYEGDIRWMYTEISSERPSALEIIRRDLYNMIAMDMTPVEAAQDLQNGLGEWYEPAQSCK